MYYPQNVASKMGPTAVFPGTQFYWGLGQPSPEVPAAFQTSEVRLTVPAGTCVIMEFDLHHRGTANMSNINRYMLKLQFVRTVQPTAPSWNNSSPTWNLSSDLQKSPRRYYLLDC